MNFLSSSFMTMAMMSLAAAFPGTASAADDATFMNVSLPYTLYSGGDGCSEDTKIGTGTTLLLKVMEDEFGAFCEVDEFPTTNSSDGRSTPTTTVLMYTKLVVTSCALNSTGLIYVKGYQCSESDCSNCDEDTEYEGYMTFTLFEGNVNSVPLPDQCFGFETLTTTTTTNMDSTTTTMFAELPADIQLLFNSTATYQLFDVAADADVADGVSEYWDIYSKHSCIGSSGDDGDDDSNGGPASLSFAAAPIGWNEYGDGDGCVESNILYTGSTVKITMMADQGMFCEEDTMVLPNGTSIPTYTKTTMQCEPPEDIDSLPDDAVYATLQTCTTADCISCGEGFTGYIDWFKTDPAVEPADTCLEWTWASTPASLDDDQSSISILQGFANTTKGYLLFDKNVTNKESAAYWGFIGDNSCIAQGPPQGEGENSSPSSSAATSSAITVSTTLVVAWSALLLIVYSN